MTPEEKKAEFNKLAPVAIKEVAGLIDENFAGFQKAQEDYRRQLPVGDPRLLEPALIPADFLSEEGMKQRGLLDEKGEATKLGEDYLFMEDEGFMKAGKLTEKGMAYIADPDELLPVDEVNDWTIFTNTFDIDKNTNLPSNPDVLSKFRQFQIRKKEGLDKSEEGNVLENLGKGLLSFGRGVYSVTPLPTMKKVVTGEGFSPSEEITKRAAVISGAVNIMADTSVKAVRLVGRPLENEEQEDFNDFVVATRVKMNRLATEPEALDAITGTSVMADTYAKTLENYKERFGEAGENKLQQELLDAKVAGQVVGDPLNIPIAIATQGVGLLAKMGTLARVSKSVNIANQTSARIARFNAAAPKVAQQLDEATKLNQTLVKQLDDAVKVGDSATVAKLTPVVANSTKAVDDLTRTATQMQEGLVVNQTARTKALTELAEKSKPLDLSIKATAAMVKSVEIAAEKLGNAAAFTNRGLRAVERTIGFYGTRRIVATSLGIGTGPLGQAALGTYYTARIGLSVAPTILNKTARFANVVGDELVQMKNSTPFWRRVAANENIGGIGKAMATTLDYASPAARFGIGSVKQGAKLAPAVAVYEAINNGGLDDEAMKRVGANALVFGAFARVVGGGKQDLAKRQTGDFYNYRTKQQKLGEDKLAAFDAIPDQTLKQFISTYDSAYPNTWDWQFTREGNSSFDPSSKTITVNVNDKSGFVRALTAHETLHSLTFKHGMDDSIVAKMLGDETRPGLVRDINGNLDKDFRQFYETYNERLDAQGLPRIGIEDAAVEFFTDNGTAALFDDVVSGKLTKAAVKTPLRRKIEDIFDTVFAATPIVKDLHYKLGGATDVNGNLVMGSGLLADGMRELPEVKAMVRKMYRESAGLPKSPIKPTAITDTPSSNPKHYKAAEIIDNINKKNVKEGKPLIDGVLNPKKGEGTGRLSEEHLVALEEAGVIKEGGAAELSFIQSAFDADKALFFENTPIEQGRSVQIAGKTSNKVKPIDFMVKNGRLYMVGMDITQLGLNINRLQRKAATLGMSRANVLTDIVETAKLHKKGISTDGYFKSVGGKDWKKRKNLINAIQGLNTKAQRLTNPMFDKLGMDKQTGTYRTFAFDRMDAVTDLTGDMVIPYGNNAYYTLKANLMPQAPRINVKGEIVKDAPNARLMPWKEKETSNGRYDRETAVKNKQVIADRFENFKPQVGVKNVTYGWQRPSDGKFIDLEQHYFLFRDANGNQLGDVLSIGYVRIVKEGNTLFYQGSPNPKQLKELKDTAIENNLDLRNDNRRLMPNVAVVPERFTGSDKDYMKAVKSGDVKTQQRMVDEAAKAAGYNRKGVRFGFYVNGVPLPPSRSAELNFGTGYYVAEGATLENTTSSSVSVSPTANATDLQRLGLKPEDVEFRRDTVFVKAEKPLRSEYGGNYDKETADFINAQLAYDSAVQEARRAIGVDFETTSWGKTVSDLIASEKLPFDSIRGMTGREGMSSELVVQNASQIKSAAPVTYNDAGNVIPLSQRFNLKSQDIRYMPQGKSKAEPTRLARDLAQKYKVPLSKVTGSGKDGTITPNDVRAFLAEREEKFKPLSFQKEPPMAVEPSISDLIGGRVEYDGMRGMIIDEDGRPFFSSDNGAVYDLPFNYFTDQSIRQLGIKPLPDFKKTQELVISKMVLNERPALQDIFGGFDKASDLVLEIAELGASMVGRGKNAKMVATTPEFDTFVSRVSDEKILAAWEQTEKALTKAQNAKNLTESTKQSVIQKLEGDIRNIETLASAWENWKRKRIPRKVSSEPAKEARTEVRPAIDKEIERALSIQSAIERKVAKAVSANTPVSPQKTPQIGRLRDNSVATGIAAALSSSGEKRNE